jgi:alanine dehydrogenase
VRSIWAEGDLNMIVGILKEIKTEENRLCMTPAGVEVMVAHGHTLLVENGAGQGSGFEDAAYAGAGAEMAEWLVWV